MAKEKGLIVPTVERKSATVEFKFASGEDAGKFEGYGSVFDNIDSYGDTIRRGAFAATLADHKAAGTMPGMYAEHSQYMMGGDMLPIGVWDGMSEDSKGLNVRGRLLALDSDYGKRVHSLMRDGALGGLSIAFSVPDTGADYGDESKGEPRRILRSIDLHSVDVVRDPANAAARVESIKGVLAIADRDEAVRAVADAIKMHVATMAGGDSPTGDERTHLLSCLQAAHKALTGEAMPKGSRIGVLVSSLRAFESGLKELFGLSNAQARAVAEHGFKSLSPREEEGNPADAAARNAAKELADLEGFRGLSFLPVKGD